MGAFDAFEPDFDALRRFDRPVYFALGGRGNPDLYARMATSLRAFWTRAESNGND
jgi:hypothetical protein